MLVSAGVTLLSVCLSIRQHLLSRQVVEGEHEAPVEVSFSCQRVVVDVRLLSVVLQTFQPATDKDGRLLFIDRDHAVLCSVQLGISKLIEISECD